jgi:ABC-type transport system substrate-binding protein
MPSKSRKLVLLIVLVISLSVVGQSLVFAAEGAARKPWEIWNYDKEKPVRGGTYVIASTTEVGLFNANHWPVMDWVSILFFWDPLFISDATKRSHPFLVESLEYTDNLTAVMKLKQGVRFHDGVDSDALAFKTQIEYIKDKANGCWSRSMMKNIESVEILDKHTIKLKFTGPWTGFIGAMQDPPGWMISPKALKGDVLVKQVKKLTKKVKIAKKKANKAKKKSGKGDAAADKKAEKLAEKALALAEELKIAEVKAKGLVSTDHKPVGTGKWIFDEYRPGNILKVKRNPDWWYGKAVGHPEMPYFDKRTTLVIPDISVQLANLRAGKIHEMSGLDKSLFEKAKKNPKLSVSARPSSQTYVLRINHNKEALKDVRVRRAISLAVDRKALVHGLFYGLADPAVSFMPHDHWARNKTMAHWEYNPEKARALLKEAGYEKGLTLNQGVVLDYMGLATLAEPIKAMLANIGITWKTQMLTMAAASDRVRNLEYDLFTDTWGVHDPQTYLTRIYHPNGASNSGRINHEKITSLIDTASTELDEGKRKQIYKSIDKLLYDEVIDIYLVYDYAITAMRSNVLGYDNEMAGRWGYLYNITHPLWFKDGKP